MAHVTTESRILIIDDDVDVRDALRDILEMRGYAVVTVESGPEALDYLQAHGQPALILLDWNMAPMNGQQFIDHICRQPALDDVPVFLLTADRDIDGKLRSSDRCRGSIAKPIDLDQLFSVAARFVGA